MNFVRNLVFAVPFVCGIHVVSGQFEQATEIRDFAIPRFDEDGHRLWVLRGKELRRQSEEIATVMEMDLMTYAATRPQDVETRLRSPSARFLLQGNGASSDQAIVIDGPDYEINGKGWSWDGDKRTVLIESEVRASFDATLTDFLESDCDPSHANPADLPELSLRPLPKEEGQTRIHSDKLELLTTDKDHKFLFTGDVRILGRNLQVTCDRLEVISTRLPDEESGPGAFGSISDIIALGRVRIEQRHRSAVAGKATIDIEAGIIVLEDDPVVFEDKGKAEGHKIILYRGERRVEVLPKPGETRASVTLPPIRDLGGTGKVNEKEKPKQLDHPRRP